MGRIELVRHSVIKVVSSSENFCHVDYVKKMSLKRSYICSRLGYLLCLFVAVCTFEAVFTSRQPAWLMKV